MLTPELAYLSYVPLCRFLGTSYMEVSLPNHDLLRSLCLQYDENNQADHAAGDTQCWWLVGSGTLPPFLLPASHCLTYQPFGEIQNFVKGEEWNSLSAVSDFFPSLLMQEIGSLIMMMVMTKSFPLNYNRHL